MKEKLLLLAGVTLLAGWMGTGTAHAQWGGGDAEGGMDAQMGEVMGALGLDDDQWGKFNDLRRQYRKNTIQMQAKIDIAEVELEELADTTDVDMRKISAKVEQIAGLQAKQRIYRYKALGEMRSFITGDQFDTFRWMAMKMGLGNKDGGKGHGGGGHH